MYVIMLLIPERVFLSADEILIGTRAGIKTGMGILLDWKDSFDSNGFWEEGVKLVY